MSSDPNPDVNPNTAHLKLSNEEYFKTELLPSLSWYNRRYILYKNIHYLLRVLVVVGGLMVAWLATSSVPHKDIIVSVMGLTFSIAAALETIFHFGETWKVYHSITLNLNTEKKNFQSHSGNYKDLSDDDAYHLLVEKVEDYNKQSSQGLVDLLTSKQD